jgi:thioredoxin 1
MPVRVICFNQEGCMGCEEQAPINREVESALGIEIETIDAVKNPQYIKQFNLRVTPTIIILEGEDVKERFEGVVQREELEEALKKYL